MGWVAVRSSHRCATGPVGVRSRGQRATSIGSIRAELTATRSRPWRSSEARSATRTLSIAAGSPASTALRRSRSSAVATRGRATTPASKKNKMTRPRRAGRGADAAPFLRPLTLKPRSERMLDSRNRFLRTAHLGQPLSGLGGVDRSRVGIEQPLPGFAFSGKAPHLSQRGRASGQGLL